MVFAGERSQRSGGEGVGGVQRPDSNRRRGHLRGGTKKSAVAELFPWALQRETGKGRTRFPLYVREIYGNLNSSMHFPCRCTIIYIQMDDQSPTASFGSQLVSGNGHSGAGKALVGGDRPASEVACRLDKERASQNLRGCSTTL